MNELSPLALQRLAYRRSRQRRSVLIAVGGTAAVVAGAIYVAVNSPGWERTRAAFFNPERFTEVFPAILSGLWLNLRVWVIASVISLILGLLLALLRSTATPALAPVRALVIVYVDVFRGVPLLLVLLLAGFGLPSLRLDWIPIDAAPLGTLAIVLTYTAYMTEIFRSGIRAVPASQIVAGRSLGLSKTQTTARIVVPQAVRAVNPALLNTIVGLQKDSGLISILGAVDAIRAAQIAVTGNYNFSPYIVAGVLFLLVSIPLTRAVDAYASRRGWVETSTGLIR